MKLTKFFAIALAAFAFVGCGPETETPADQPSTPLPEPTGKITLSADKTSVEMGETVTFTVTDSDNQDVTAVATIYDQDLNEITGAKFTASATGTYSFFATCNDENSNYLVICVLASMPEVPADPDPSNFVFNHRPLVIDHTGVNCGYCPYAMDYLLQLEASEWHGKYNEVTCHAGGYANGDPAASSAATALNTFQASNIAGYPSIIINFYTPAADYGLASMKSALNKVWKKSGAEVGISVAVEADSETVMCAAEIKSNETKVYYVNAWLLENDIYSPNQANATKDHHKIYNYALRNFSESVTRTSVAGLDLGTIKAGESYTYGCAIPVTNKSWVSENMGVLVVVSAKDANNRIEVVNSAYCEVGEALEFEYL